MDSTAVNKSAILFVILEMFFVAQLACTRPNPAADPNPTAAPPAQAELVDQILERYTEAVGGKAAIEGVTSYKAEGTFASSLLPEPGAFKVWGRIRTRL